MVIKNNLHLWSYCYMASRDCDIRCEENAMKMALQITSTWTGGGGPACVRIWMIVPKKSANSCVNDYHCMALTSVIMKCFDKLILQSNKLCILISMYFFQFSISTEDAISSAYGFYRRGVTPNGPLSHGTKGKSVEQQQIEMKKMTAKLCLPTTSLSGSSIQGLGSVIDNAS